MSPELLDLAEWECEMQAFAYERAIWAEEVLDHPTEFYPSDVFASSELILAFAQFPPMDWWASR